MPSRQAPDPAGPPLQAAAATRNHHHHHLLLLAPLAAAMAIAAALSIAAAALLAVLVYRRLARSRAAAAADPMAPPPPPAALRRFTYSQLRRAANGFSPSHRLGQGGFGPVFRAALPSGQHVAVKLMDSGSLQGEREFLNELALAARMSAIGSPADRAWVVPPFGYCSSVKTRCRCRWSRWRRKAEADEDTAAADAATDAPVQRLLLVYELMQNGSLQGALLDRRCSELMDWSRRFSVAVDIARGLQFLHTVCDPPVIHGDIKPSNILLDGRLSARIADFGLARLKSNEESPPTATQLNEEAAVIDVDEAKSGRNGKELMVELPEEIRNDGGGAGGEDDASVMGETAESTTTNGFDDPPIHGPNGIAGADKSPEEDDGFARGQGAASSAAGFEVASTSDAGAFDRMSVDSGTASSNRRAGRKKAGVLPGKDWWWRQDAGGGGSSEQGGSVKDYVMEWIRSEIKKERPKSDWISATPASTQCPPKPAVRPDRKKQQRRLEWWASLDEEKLTRKEKGRPAREWWREEFCEELTNKQKRRMIMKSHSTVGAGEKQWWQNDDDSMSTTPKKKRRKKKGGSRGSRASLDWCMDSASGEARTAARHNSRDWASGDIPRSGTISSTPSMRGTVCYVAPEYGGGGPLSEKCDIYSFGVLLLVVISGRRPLQVMASPMSEFERANLISWARHLSHLGRLLDLLDTSLRAVDRDQALLCITVALLCIQRSPARRPSIKEIVAMLTGQMEPPHLPLEFSPSPPGGFSFKSRKKVR